MNDIHEQRGVCFFAYNNDQLDYVKMALTAGKYVKKNLQLPVCLITNEGSEEWLRQSQTKKLINEVLFGN